MHNEVVFLHILAFVEITNSSLFVLMEGTKSQLSGSEYYRLQTKHM